MAYRYDYARRKSYDAAQVVIEQMWAEGILGYVDDPRVERRGKWFYVTLKDEA
jgi:hypothetical protein